MDYCPMCNKNSILYGTCQGCRGNFKTGKLTLRIKRPREFPVLLPKISEVMPTRLAKILRDPNWKYEKRCGIRAHGLSKK